MKAIFGFLKMFIKWIGISILVILSSVSIILSLPVWMILGEDEEDPTINDEVQETKEQIILNEEKLEES